MNWCKMDLWKLNCMVKHINFILCFKNWQMEGKRKMELNNANIFIFQILLIYRTFSWFGFNLAYANEDCSWYSKVSLFTHFLNYFIVLWLGTWILTYLQLLTRGLEYLHEHCNPSVIHRDLKTSNILLDSNFNAKVKFI